MQSLQREIIQIIYNLSINNILIIVVVYKERQGRGGRRIDNQEFTEVND